MRERLRQYYTLTKPGIIRGNLIVAAGGFLLASRGHVDAWRLLAMLAGMSLVIASACVFNNYLDREIDKKMQRTQKRALVTGAISVRSALVFASTLGVLGVYTLAAFVNHFTAYVGLVGFVAYVVVYGVAKRRSVHGTVVGSISGAIPPVAGYTAVTGRLDLEALLLFLVLVTWQMPHFYAIAVFRSKDYAAAGLPVLPIKRGVMATKLQITAYIVAFIAVCLALSGLGYTGYSYLVVMALLGLAWLRLALKGFTARDDNAWARQVFGFSLVVLLAFSLMIGLNSLLP